MQFRGSKKATVLFMLEASGIDAHVDARLAGVVVPEQLRGFHDLLRVGRDSALAIDDEGISGVLTVAGEELQTNIPWRSVYAAYGEDGRGFLWLEDEPVEAGRRRAAVASAERGAWSAAVDALAELPASRPPGEAGYRASARDVLCGRWVGCSMNPTATFRPMAMDVEIDIRGGPGACEIVGEGVDSVARFSLEGRLDGTGEIATFRKRYADTGHSVAHTAVLDGLAMRGTCEVGDAAGLFVVWRASELDASAVDGLARRARLRFGSSLGSLLASFIAGFRFATHAECTRLIEQFRSFPAVARHAKERSITRG